MVERALLRDKHVIVVGAGVGGLVSAMLLANQGVRVTLVESAAHTRAHHDDVLIS